LRLTIESIKEKIPRIAAFQRSVDTDLLEQELKIQAGLDLTDEDAEKKARLDGTFADMQKNLDADAALAALKEKMRSR
jgi:hypothetical protein